MQLIRYLTPKTFTTAGQDSGADFTFKDLPVDLDGGAVYARAVMIRVTGSITSTGGSATAAMARLLGQITINIPGIGDIVNLTGSRVARNYRLENRGDIPPKGAAAYNVWATLATLNAGANAAVDMTYPIEFARTNGHDPDDTSIPIALLKHATFKVKNHAFTDIIADETASSLVVSPYVVLMRKPKPRLGPITILDSVDLSVGTMPPLDAARGRIVTAGVSPTNELVFASTTDMAQIGLSFGPLVISENTTPSPYFYAVFNETSTTDIASHTTALTDPTASLPLVFPAGYVQGQHITYEAVPAGYKPKIQFDAGTQTYTLVRRQLLGANTTEWQAAAALMGARGLLTESKTADGRAPSSSAAAAYSPKGVA